MYESPATPSRRRLAEDPGPLSGQELRVLQLLSEGRVYKEIAAELGLSVSTIRSHLHGIYRKLDVPDRAQAVICASKRSWLQAA
jgi:DNA-binding NarL/FixJ family response regulator